MVIVTVPSAATPSEDPEPLLQAASRGPAPATAVRPRPPRSRLRREMRVASGSFRGMVWLLFPSASGEARTVKSSPLRRRGLRGLFDISNVVRYNGRLESSARPRRVSTSSSGPARQESEPRGRPGPRHAPRARSLRFHLGDLETCALQLRHDLGGGEPVGDQLV